MQKAFLKEYARYFIPKSKFYVASIIDYTLHEVVYVTNGNGPIS